MRYLAQAEIKEIINLRSQNWSLKNLANRFAVCEATISKHVNGKTKVRNTEKRGGRAKRKSLFPTYSKPFFEEVDLSKLPDDALFEHVRECNFIG